MTTENTNSQSKKIFIKTYGCQMNVYDSEKMQSLMAEQGYSISDDMDNSDLIVINTCHIREKASEKMYSELGRIRKLKDSRKEQGKQTIVAVAGCVAQAEGEFIKDRAPYVDVIVGPQSFTRLPQMVNNALAGNTNNVELDFSTVEKFDFLNEEKEQEKEKQNSEIKVSENNIAETAPAKKIRPSAFLTIQEGCDKFCTFCVVPYTRGAEVSRSVAEIYREAVRLVEQEGVKEITLLGQNVNAYHGKIEGGKTWGLGALCEHLAKINGLERIRYSTSHPRDMDDELIFAHRDIPKLMPFVHLPVQSGSDRILKQMNRKHTAAEYFEIIDKFRAARPDIEFSSDFIVGYPGETEKDFQDSMDLIERVNFSLSYSFIYSARPGTPAANKTDDVPLEAKVERLKHMQDVLEKQMFAKCAEKVGKILPVHITRQGKFEGQLQGFTPYMQPVIVENASQHFNQIVNVKLSQHTDRALKGEIVPD